MGWSKRGLKVMAELRAYVSSGGKLTLKHLRAKKEDRSYKINENISLNVSDNFKEAKKQIRNIAILTQGKVTPIFRCLKGLTQGSIQL
ncbi:UPF0236 family protein [Peptococcaceae bacterium]|nr:UPF0236 family protein [Peptococcaceae bacterium]